MTREGKRAFRAEGTASIKTPGKDLGMFWGPKITVDDEGKSELREGGVDRSYSVS